MIRWRQLLNGGRPTCTERKIAPQKSADLRVFQRQDGLADFDYAHGSNG